MGYAINAGCGWEASMARDEMDDLERDDESTEDEELDVDTRPGGSGVGFLVGLVLGALVGAGTALLLAPERGAVTRRKLRRRMQRMGHDAADRVGDLRDGAEREFRRARRRVRRHLPD